MKYNHKLNIAGVELPLTSSNNEKYVQALASELSRRMNTLTSSAVGISKLEAALVCALDLLDENCNLKLDIEELKKGTKA